MGLIPVSWPESRLATEVAVLFQQSISTLVVTSTMAEHSSAVHLEIEHFTAALTWDTLQSRT